MPGGLLGGQLPLGERAAQAAAEPCGRAGAVSVMARDLESEFRCLMESRLSTVLCAHRYRVGYGAGITVGTATSTSRISTIALWQRLHSTARARQDCAGDGPGRQTAGACCQDPISDVEVLMWWSTVPRALLFNSLRPACDAWTVSSFENARPALLRITGHTPCNFRHCNDHNDVSNNRA